MLLADPHVVSDAGFQLSAAATAGLVAWATPLTARWHESFPRLPGFICETLGVSLAAQVATLPIALATFGRLALIAPAANLVAVPLVAPTMAAGALALASGWLAVAGLPAWVAGLLALPGHLLLTALVGVVEFMAAVPGANETLPVPLNLAAAGLAAIGAVWFHRWLSRRPNRALAGAAGPAATQGGERFNSFGTATGPGRDARRSDRAHSGSGLPKRMGWAVAAAALAAAAAGSVVSAAPDGAVHVIVLDVGQGDAILLEGDRGSRMLVDGGPDGNALLSELDRYVPAWDRRIDAVVLTHPHDDHVGGLAALLGRYRVGRAFQSGWPATSSASRAWREALAAAGLKPDSLETGAKLQLDDAALAVLWPDDGTNRPPGLDPAASDNRETNDSSIVLLGEYEGRRFLLTGDIEDDVDPVLIARGLPAVDMLKVAHHGSATATSDALLSALRPRVAAISVGANNDYGHPSTTTLARLRQHAGSVYRTDQAGSVEVTLDRGSVRVSASGRTSSAQGSQRKAVESPFGDWPAPARVAAAADPGPLVATVRSCTIPGDVRAQPPREHGAAPLTRPTHLASATLPGRGRGRRMAGAEGLPVGASGGPPARGVGRSPP